MRMADPRRTLRELCGELRDAVTCLEAEAVNKVGILTDQGSGVSKDTTTALARIVMLVTGVAAVLGIPMDMVMNTVEETLEERVRARIL